MHPGNVKSMPPRPLAARSELPPLDLLRSFESAARHLSFTRAAQELFLTQSAVSRQIQQVEANLGVPLFIGTIARWNSPKRAACCSGRWWIAWNGCAM